MLKRSIIIIFFFFFVKLFFTGAKRSHLQKIKHIWLFLLPVLMLDDVPCCNRHQTHSNIKSQCHFCCCFKGSYWLRLRSCLLWDQIRLDSPINTSDYFPKSFRNQTQAICHSLNNSSQSLEIELFDHFFGFFQN
jgi:hypothetical protein